ncbi:MAG TPA: hypothetical protein ENK57_25655 [Polyangiaceae bacterium]|nr:hypothetical protein [Polyangiaceae bacterium]
MRTQWEALHRDLVRSVNTLTARKSFERVRQTRRALRRFTAPGVLIEHLHRGDDRDEKDRIYAALVELLQAGGDEAEVASTLLWLGLWPALDAIYRRRLRHFLNEPEALVSEIGARFTRVIHRADLRRINRVAATLTRNVNRDIGDALKRAWAEQARRADLPREDLDDDHEGSTGDRRRARRSERLRTRGVSDLGLPPSLDPDDDVRALRTVLVEIVGGDAELVIGVAIHGESQRELGQRLGLSHEATRKRYQRAVARIRERFGGRR